MINVPKTLACELYCLFSFGGGGHRFFIDYPVATATQSGARQGLTFRQDFLVRLSKCDMLTMSLSPPIYPPKLNGAIRVTIVALPSELWQ